MLRFAKLTVWVQVAFLAHVAVAEPDYVPFVISVSAPQKDVLVGSEVAIHITGVNIGHVPVEMNQKLKDKLLSGYNVIVRDATGRELQRRAGARECHPDNDKPMVVPCKGKFVITTLQPGERVDEDLMLSDEYDLTSPGDYIITVQRIIHLTDGAGPKEIAKSNELVITVK